MPHTIYQQLLEFSSNPDAQAAEIVRHYETRQKLGAGLIITNSNDLHPYLARHWKRLIRGLQSERDVSTDADEKLRLTSKIVRMQASDPGGKIAEPNLTVINETGLEKISPGHYKTIYILTEISERIAEKLIDDSSGGTLLIGQSSRFISGPHIEPKTTLDRYAEETWQELLGFLAKNKINIGLLIKPSTSRSQHIDDALDRLLDTSVARDFLRLVNTYRSQALLAAPLQLSSLEERERKTVALLARQVQTFSGSLFDIQFTANDDDPIFFLNDYPLARVVVNLKSQLGPVIWQEQVSHAELKTDPLLSRAF